MSSVLIHLVIVLILAYVAWGLMLLFMQPKLLYRPIREVDFDPDEFGLAHEHVAFSGADGVMLTGCYIPAARADFTLLFCHGNGGNITHQLDSAKLFHSLGLNCFVFDYRGYGRSTGRPGEAGTYRDARAAFDWLMQTKQIPADRIIVCGRSLGGSIAAYLATQVQPAALAVEGAFTSYPDIGAKFYPYLPVRRFARFQYDTRAYISRVRCPVMVVHSRDDELVPFDFGTRLFQAAREPKRFVEIFGDHNDGCFVSGDLYTEAWTTWLGFLKTHQSEDVAPKAS